MTAKIATGNLKDFLMLNPNYILHCIVVDVELPLHLMLTFSILKVMFRFN